MSRRRGHGCARLGAAASLALAAALAGCGQSPPVHPAVDIFNRSSHTLAVEAPGVSAASVACGQDLLIHPTGALPWTVTVRWPGTSRQVTVPTNGEEVLAADDAAGSATLVAMARADNGPPPHCASSP